MIRQGFFGGKKQHKLFHQHHFSGFGKVAGFQAVDVNAAGNRFARLIIAIPNNGFKSGCLISFG